MRVGLLPLLLLSLAPLAAAAPPNCALLDPEKIPQAALLEAKLLADADGTWVERAQIDKILKEQKLQAMFSPQGVGDRVKLGKLLKADVLVMVRPVKDAKEPTLELAVSETAGGLRLLVRAVPVTKNVAEDVAVLVAAVREGVKLHGEEIREVVAVPPFVSNDLEFAQDHLKGALAKLTETETLRRKGVVVVELAEADALAKELALTDPGARLNRPLPIYLLGEYRHDGAGQERRITLKLRAERGGKPVGKLVELKAIPKEGPAAVRKWAAETLDAVANDVTPRPPADPKAEAKMLALRSGVFHRLGNWDEAIALAEAGLLIDPVHVDLHVAIMAALGDPVERAMHAAMGGRDAKATERFLRLYRYGWEHLEGYIVGGGDPARHRAVSNLANSSIVQKHRGRAYYLNFPPNCSPEVKELILEAARFERALFARLLRAPAVANSPPDIHIDYLYPALTHFAATEKYAVVERLIVDLPAAPGSAAKATMFASVGFWASDEPGQYGTGKAYESFKARVTDGKLKFASAAKAELDRLERMEADKKAYRPPVEVAEPDVDGVRFTPVKLTIEGPKPGGPEPLKGLSGILAVGSALDVVWDSTNIYTMKKKGILVPVRMPPAWDASGANIVFDGKYVWVSSIVIDKASRLAAFDPDTGKVWDLTDLEGLPQPTPEFLKKNRFVDAHALAPLGPGKMCVAGFHGRTWVAVVALDPPGKSTVKVIHEARDAVDPQDAEQWKKATVAFTPGSARTLRGLAGDKPVTRVLIGRNRSGIWEIDGHSVLVEPEGGAEVLQTRLPSFLAGGSTAQMGPTVAGALYFQDFVIDGKPRLMRLTMPGSKVEIVAKEMPRGTQVLFPDGAKFHAIEAKPPLATAPPGSVRSRWYSNWWTLDPGAEKPRLVGSGLPPIPVVGISSHYGLFALVQSPDRDPRIGLHTVEFVTPPKPK